MSGISRFGAHNQASSQLNFVGSRGRGGIKSFGAAPESVQQVSKSNAPQAAVQSTKNVTQAAAQNIKTVSPVSAPSTTLGARIDVKA